MGAAGGLADFGVAVGVRAPALLLAVQLLLTQHIWSRCSRTPEPGAISAFVVVASIAIERADGRAMTSCGAVSQESLPQLRLL